VTGLADLAPARTPAQPGPGPLPEAALRSLDLAVRRRVDGMLSGEFRSSQLGVATELAQVRPYEPGDDVRQIDWLATARTNETHVRVHVAERALTTWLLLDRSISMQFGTADRRKTDVAEGVALALGHVASRRGNRLGVVTSGSGAAASRRPRQGRAGLLAALLALRTDDTAPRPGDSTSLAEGFDHASRVARQRSLLVIVSDLRGELDWAVPLTRLAARHDALVIEVRDPREESLEDAGELTLVDPETGEQVFVDTSSRKLRAAYADAASAERKVVADAVRRAGADHVVLSTRGEWLRPLLVALARRERLGIS
jgi:uncharacterized protein (DUF58 family)